jgi:hypothetical protein
LQVDPDRAAMSAKADELKKKRAYARVARLVRGDKVRLDG